MTTKKLIRALLIIGAIIIGLLIFFIYPVRLDSTALKDTVRFEIIKSLLELLVITIFGGIIAELFKAGEFNRQQALILVNLRFDLVKRLGVMYNAVKLVRREFRAAGLSTKVITNPAFDSPEKWQLYLDKMKRLNELQLGFEELKREAKSSPAFRTFESVYKELKKMEDYLRQLVKEYEKVPKNEKAGMVKFNDLERLDEFTTSTKKIVTFCRYTEKIDYRFKTHLSISYDKIIETLVDEPKRRKFRKTTKPNESSVSHQIERI